MVDIPIQGINPSLVAAIRPPSVPALQPSGLNALSNSLAQAGRRLQEENEKERQAQLRVALQRLNTAFASSLGEARRDGTFNLGDFQSRYEQGLDSIRKNFNTTPVDEVLLGQSRLSAFSELENTETRNFMRREEAGIITNAHVQLRNMRDWLSKNSDYTLEEAEEYASILGQGLISDVIPVQAERARTSFLNQATIMAERGIKARVDTRHEAIKTLLDGLKSETTRYITRNPQLNVSQIDSYLNRIVGNAAIEHKLVPEETVFIAQALYDVHARRTASAANTAYEIGYLTTKSSIERIWENAERMLELERPVDLDALRSQTAQLLQTTVGDEHADKLLNLSMQLENKFLNKQDTIQTENRRVANVEVYRQNLDQLTEQVRMTPAKLDSSIKQLRMMVSILDQESETRIEQIASGETQLRETAVSAIVKQYLTNVTKAGRINTTGDLVEALKGERPLSEVEFVDRGPSGTFSDLDIDQIVGQAEREWREEFREQSQAKLDVFMTGIDVSNTATLQMVLSDNLMTADHKAEYRRAWEDEHRAFVNSEDLLSDLTTPGVTIPQDDHRKWDLWNVRQLKQGLMTQPTQIAPVLNRIGLNKNIVSDMWGTVTSGTTEEASQLLVGMSYLDEDILRNALSKDQYGQFVYWKYARTEPTEEAAIQQIRAMVRAGDTAQRKARETVYNEELRDNPEDFTAEAIIDLLDLEDANMNSPGVHRAVADYAELYRHYFLKTGDEDVAEEMAEKLILKDWGENLNGDIMYLPPNITLPTMKFYNQATRVKDHGWIPRQIYREIENAGIALTQDQLESVRLVTSENTIRAFNAGQVPEYELWYTGEYGILSRLTQEQLIGPAFDNRRSLIPLSWRAEADEITVRGSEISLQIDAEAGLLLDQEPEF